MKNTQIITSLVVDECCICLEKKDIVYKCVECNVAKLCRTCYLQMRKHQKSENRCPSAAVC